jgi:hypothetical protein
MKRWWQSRTESEKIAAQLIALAALGFLYFVWPTPYIWGVRMLPQYQPDMEPPPTAAYRVQVNRFTGTVWADTVVGWRRFEQEPLPESELAFEAADTE